MTSLSRLLVPFVAAALLGAGMRLLAYIAGADWATTSGVTRPIMTFVNLAAIWVAVLAVATAWSCRKRAIVETVAVAWLSAWVALGVYYGSVVPSAPHERIWFSIGSVAVVVCSIVLKVVRPNQWLVVLGLLFLLEAAALMSLTVARGGDATSHVLWWCAEGVAGTFLLVVSRGRARHR